MIQWQMVYATSRWGAGASHEKSQLSLPFFSPMPRRTALAPTSELQVESRWEGFSNQRVV